MVYGGSNIRYFRKSINNNRQKTPVVASRVTSPIQVPENYEVSPEFLTKKCNDAIIAGVKPQITTHVLKYDITPNQFIDQLLKQGKFPNKNFTIERSTHPDRNSGSMAIREVNKEGKKTKETTFTTNSLDNPEYSLRSIKVYSKRSDAPYRTISYSQKKDGRYLVEESDPQTAEKVSRTLYSKDGSAQIHENY